MNLVLRNVGKFFQIVQIVPNDVHEAHENTQFAVWGEPRMYDKEPQMQWSTQLTSKHV